MDPRRSCIEAGSRLLYQKYLYHLVESEHEICTVERIVVGERFERPLAFFANPEAL
jgi:hypothetical protein